MDDLDSKPIILITGATGYIGRRLTHHLLHQNRYDVRLFVRNKRKIQTAIADSVEIMAQAHPFDGLVLIPNCDKVTPGMLMAMLRVNIPSVMVSGGPMLTGRFQGKDVHLVSVFEGVGQVKANTMTEDELNELEDSACPGCGSCAGMFTANSMNCLTEAIGLGLPGNGTIPAVASARIRLAKQAGISPQEYSRQVTKACFLGKTDPVFQIDDLPVGAVDAFVLGFDHDGPEVFSNTMEWVEENRLECATFHIMTPYPGTALYRRLQREGRLLHDDWSQYDILNVTFRPRNMTPEELAKAQEKADEAMRLKQVLAGSGGRMVPGALAAEGGDDGGDRVAHVADLVDRERTMGGLLQLLQRVGLAQIHHTHADKVVEHFLISQRLTAVGIDPNQAAVSRFRRLGRAHMSG